MLVKEKPNRYQKGITPHIKGRKVCCLCGFPASCCSCKNAFCCQQNIIYPPPFPSISQKEKEKK